MINKKNAFSTIEMLLTVMIFSLGIIPLIVLFQNSHKQTAQAKNLMIAQSIGRTKINELRSLGFDYLAEELGGSSNGLQGTQVVKGKLVDSDDDSIEYPECYNRFKTSVKFEDSGERPTANGEKKPANKIRIWVDVEWQEPNARKFSLAFGTVVVKYDS